MKKLRPNLRKQAGMSMASAVFYLAIAAALAFSSYAIYITLTADQRNQSAFNEVTYWLNSMHQMGVIRGFVYTGLDQTNLIAETTIENANNVYGTPITIAVTGTNWQLSYTFPDQASCQYVRQRIINYPWLIAANPTACSAAGVLTATIE